MTQRRRNRGRESIRKLSLRLLLLLLTTARLRAGRGRRGLDDDKGNVRGACERVEALEVIRHHLIELPELRVDLRSQLFVERVGLLGRLRVGARDDATERRQLVVEPDGIVQRVLAALV